VFILFIRGHHELFVAFPAKTLSTVPQSPVTPRSDLIFRLLSIISTNSTKGAFNTRAITKSPKMRSQAQIEASRRNGAKLRPVGFPEERVVETNTVTDWELGLARVAHATILQERLTTDHFIAPNEFEKFLKQTEPEPEATPAPIVTDTPGEPRLERSGVSQPETPTSAAPVEITTPAPKKYSIQTEPNRSPTREGNQ
jgi:hypothetical protein